MATVMVTGATGYVGGELVPALLAAGHRVRVLTRDRSALDAAAWAADIEIVEGDVGDAATCRQTLTGIDVAYYLVHSMDGAADFAGRDRRLAETFAEAAAATRTGRIVYLSGLHPDGELSDHLRSRVEVGEVFLASPVPSIVFQAGVVLGAGSASFDMLRHLTERLPAMVAPRWVANRIQPIAVADVVHYLVGSVDLPAGLNRSFDVGGPDVLTYAEMMHRYARVVGLGRRLIATVPMLTPRLAGLWVAFVTPVGAGIARPLVGSLEHEAVCHEDDVLTVIGPPPGGPTNFDDAVRAAVRTVDPLRWRHTLRRTAAIVSAAAVAGSLFTDPRSRWYRRLDTPSWQPPARAFAPIWTTLYATTAIATAAASTELAEPPHPAPPQPHAAATVERTLAVNMVLNAAWPLLFFRLRRLRLATAECAVLTASSVALARRVAAARTRTGAGVGVYAAWCGFATVLNATIARRNRGTGRWRAARSLATARLRR